MPAHVCIRTPFPAARQIVERRSLVGIRLEKWEPREGSRELCGLREAVRAAACTCPREEHLWKELTEA